MDTQTAPTPWTAEETAELRRLVEVEGVSLRAAGPMLGREPHAAISKARREGIKSKHPSGQVVLPNSRRSLRKKRAEARASGKPSAPKAKAVKPEREPQARIPRAPQKPTMRVKSPFAPLEGVEPIAFDDLEATNCRWPIQRGTFCGAFALPGSGPLGACYCPTHSAIARA